MTKSFYKYVVACFSILPRNSPGKTGNLPSSDSVASSSCYSRFYLNFRKALTGIRS
jgi:hypothetical protein